jgi:hypothetical protein
LRIVVMNEAEVELARLERLERRLQALEDAEGPRSFHTPQGRNAGLRALETRNRTVSIPDC